MRKQRQRRQAVFQIRCTAAEKALSLTADSLIVSTTRRSPATRTSGLLCVSVRCRAELCTPALPPCTIDTFWNAQPAKAGEFIRDVVTLPLHLSSSSSLFVKRLDHNAQSALKVTQL